MTAWRVMLNKNLWNQSLYEENFATMPEVRRIAQSKGRCAMKRLPLKGDTVYFVLKGRIVMRGFVDSEGFETGTAHQAHSCNVGAVRAHAGPQEYAWVVVNQIGLSEPIRATGQRTWAKMPTV